MSNTFFIHSAFAAVSEGCNMFEITFDCDLSGWMKLILGDITIAASLALFLHYLAHRSNVKIEQNSTAIKNNNINIQKIITEQERIRKRRKTYVIQSLKNHLGALLLYIGIMSKFPDSLSHEVIEKNKEIESILQRAQNTLNLSVDVIDPMLVEQMERFLVVVEQNVQKEKSLDYDKLKNNITQLAKRLDECSDSTDIIK